MPFRIVTWYFNIATKQNYKLTDLKRLRIVILLITCRINFVLYEPCKFYNQPLESSYLNSITIVGAAKFLIKRITLLKLLNNLSLITP